MSTSEILKSLEIYAKTWGSEQYFPAKKWSFTYELEKIRRFQTFIHSQPSCFQRSNLLGHMTGSALVVNSDLTKVLLTHHRKLDMWLQLGGHADGNHLLQHVAMTEAHEESGLTQLVFLNYESNAFGSMVTSPIPFDLDDHLIPANKKDPEHHHFDVRYLIVASEHEQHTVTEESHDVRWFTIPEARQVTSELSMHRQFDKAEALRALI